MARLFEGNDTEVKLRAANERINAMTVRLRQQEEQYKNKVAHLMAVITQLRHIEESARNLCTLILSKDRSEMLLGGNYTWNSVDSEELIHRTQESYKAYCKGRVETLQTLKDVAVEKAQQLEEANDVIVQLRSTNSTLRASSISETEKTAIRDSISQAQSTLMSKFAHSNVVMDDDDVDKAAPLTASAVREREEAKARRDTTNALRQQMKSPQKQSEIQRQAESDVITHPSQEVIARTAVLTEPEKKVLLALSHGHSISSEVRTETGLSNAGFSEAHSLLLQSSLVATEAVSFPGTSNPKAIWLTTTGKQTCYVLFQEVPAEAECERIRKVHANLEHGYGIRAFYRLLKGCGRYKKINMFAKAIDLRNGKSYQPDILASYVLDDGTAVIEYFEYEKVKQTREEYFAKFNKMSLVTDQINVLVASSSDHLKMQNILYQWASNHKNDPIIAQKTIRLSSFHIMKKNIENGNPFDEWWFVSERVANFPAPKDM